MKSVFVFVAWACFLEGMEGIRCHEEYVHMTYTVIVEVRGPGVEGGGETLVVVVAGVVLFLRMYCI